MRLVSKRKSYPRLTVLPGGVSTPRHALIVRRRKKRARGAPEVKDIGRAMRKAQETQYEDALQKVREGRGHLDVVIERQGAIAAGAPGLVAADSGHIEVRAMENLDLRQARDMITEAIKEGARDVSPLSLAFAQKIYHEAETFIATHRGEEERAKSRIDKAEASASHLLKMTRISKSGGKSSSAQPIPQIECEQNMTFDEQIQIREAQVDAESTDVLMARNRALATELAFHRTFESAQAAFTRREAEVYRQGDNLILRLRGLDFLSSQTRLMECNFPLLDKVQKVIESFEHCSVKISGHADSQGLKEVNDKLSTERAETVKEYFLKKFGVHPIDITTTGYGDRRPLTTNKSLVGRAQNRRVDILIQAERPASTVPE